LPKRALKLEVLDERWSYSLTQSAQAAHTQHASAPVVQTPQQPQPAPGSATMPPPIATPALQWHLNVNGVNYGPFAHDLLRSMIPTGQFGAQTMVWREGMPAWLPACTVPELSSLFMPTPVMPPVLNTGMPPSMSASLPPAPFGGS